MVVTTQTPCGAARQSRSRFAPALAISLLAACLLSACATQPAAAPQASLTPPPATLPNPPPSAPVLAANGPKITGTASWYKPGPGLHHTCTGTTFTASGMTAASHSIPLGTKVRVAMLDDPSRSVVVKVNDCMPHNGRLLDLSEGAARDLGMISQGIAQVSVTPVILVDAD